MTLAASPSTLIEEIRQYWNSHIHDLEVVRHEVGTLGFFEDLDEYRFDKLRYLPRLVDFSGFAGKRLLEVGCGAGVDLVRFARGGAIVTGIDLAEQSIALTKQNFALRGLSGEFLVMNGEAMDFADNSFDVVYAHGVLQYTADAGKMIREIYRVLKPGGEAIMMVYNRHSWLRLLSKVMHVALEHEDAPVLRVFSAGEFRKLLEGFRQVRLVCERFPVRTRLHGGVKGLLYNWLFVPAFSVLPKPLIRWSGWHIMAFARK
ncbi:MAG: methyltransferase domain-containing protein [candidate division KSB1 bacterium]|nr:methyltransferase domain-containing protein [candidate division KSB1 bacterium]MDZ7379491.1 methyltransferase domain-containing protein [candidate division KSB1 bacterium]MDZ7391281.1 methyltransferase domain-containing protein [candidate division KSB1 bacterium]